MFFKSMSRFFDEHDVYHHSNETAKNVYSHYISGSIMLMNKSTSVVTRMWRRVALNQECMLLAGAGDLSLCH